MILTIPEMDSLVCDPHWSLQRTCPAKLSKPNGDLYETVRQILQLQFTILQDSVRLLLLKVL